MTTGLTPDQLTDAMPFARALGMEIDTAGPGEVTGHLDWAPDRCTAGGLMHGGALMALADTLGAACAFLNLPPDTSTSTLESKTNFFRGVRSGTVTGTSRPLHAGRSFITVQTNLVDADDRLIAQVTQTQAVLRR
ncbi:PaaI family thioesterase [Actinomadura luteofluorescens]|uniref:PaaI family thioesterase n=1 Tax=Actinomadura luteofluorescens TaxID=46163 RepID=UPI0034719194